MSMKTCGRTLWCYLIITLCSLHLTHQKRISQQDIKDIKDHISSRVGDLQDRFDYIDDEQEKVNNRLDILTDGLKTIISDLAHITEILVDTNDKMAYLKRDLTDIKDNSQAMNNQIAELKIKSYRSSKSLKSSVESSLQNISKEIQALKTQIKPETPGLKEPNSNKSKSVQSLEKKVDEILMFERNSLVLLNNIRNDSENMKFPIDEIRSKVLSLEGNVDEILMFESNSSDILNSIRKYTASAQALNCTANYTRRAESKTVNPGNPTQDTTTATTSISVSQTATTTEDNQKKTCYMCTTSTKMSREFSIRFDANCRDHNYDGHTETRSGNVGCATIIYDDGNVVRLFQAREDEQCQYGNHVSGFGTRCWCTDDKCKPSASTVISTRKKRETGSSIP